MTEINELFDEPSMADSQNVTEIAPLAVGASHHVARGKFRSLTLINWNGFFARTFDLDDLVTTLSGGNGAGKSTTMAGFVTALIPDLTLLNFRNTTEAGSTSSSRIRVIEFTWATCCDWCSLTTNCRAR